LNYTPNNGHYYKGAPYSGIFYVLRKNPKDVQSMEKQTFYWGKIQKGIAIAYKNEFP